MWRRAKRACALVLLSLCLSGCATKVNYVPTYLLDSGERVIGTAVVQPDGTEREISEGDATPLFFIPNSEPYNLVYKDLSIFEGNFYSLSQYYYTLLQNGYVVESSLATSDTIDCVLENDGDRVRLVYFSNGNIRILFENWEGSAHILLERM